MFARSLLAVALLCSCSQPPTSVSIKITTSGGSEPKAPLLLSVFDAHHALATRISLGDQALPLVAVAYNLPSSAETVRLVLTRQSQPIELGAAKLSLVPHARANATIELSASTPDRDGDGIPDSVDNCPDTANPDQASASGLAGDKCTSGSDLGLDMAVPITDMGAPTPDLGDLASLYAFTYTLPTHVSLFYGGHDPPPATINFSSNADSVSCSHDDGATFTGCETPASLVFTPDDYTSGATLQIKLGHAGWPTYVASLNPKQLMPGLTFYNCDQVVTADEATSVFAKRLAAGRVICIGPSVGITDSSTHVDDGGMKINPTGIYLENGNATGTKIIGTETSSARFFNPDVGGNQGILISMDATVQNMVVANLSLTSADGNPISFDTSGGNNWFSNLTVQTGGGEDQAIVFSNGLEQLYNVTVHVENSINTPAITVGGSATVVYSGGHIFGRDDTNAVYVNGGNLTLNNVFVDNAIQTTTMTKIAAIQVASGILKISGGTVSSPYNDGIDLIDTSVLTLLNTSVMGSAIGLSITDTSNVSVSGSTITTNGVGIRLMTSLLTIDNSNVERLDATGTAGPAISVIGTGNSIDSSADKNHFCDANKAGSNVFTGSVVDDVASGGMYNGTFTLANQVNAGAVDQCP